MDTTTGRNQSMAVLIGAARAKIDRAFDIVEGRQPWPQAGEPGNFTVFCGNYVSHLLVRRASYDEGFAEKLWRIGDRKLATSWSRFSNDLEPTVETTAYKIATVAMMRQVTDLLCRNISFSAVRFFTDVGAEDTRSPDELLARVVVEGPCAILPARDTIIENPTWRDVILALDAAKTGATRHYYLEGMRVHLVDNGVRTIEGIFGT